MKSSIFKHVSLVALCRVLFGVGLLLLCTLSAAAQCDVQQTYKLLANDAVDSHFFGTGVAVSGTTAIVGASSDDEMGYQAGAAYLFDTETGLQLAKLLPDDLVEGDRFGEHVAIDGTTALVRKKGAVYVFDTTPPIDANLQPVLQLLPNDAGAVNFGTSIAINELGTIAIAGASGDSAILEDAGSAYLFNTSTGEQLAKLVAGDPQAGDRFGNSVAINETGTTAIIGASMDEDGKGAAYLFNLTGPAQYNQVAKLVASDGEGAPGDPNRGDRFGWSVGISGTTAIVGAIFDNNDNGEYSGSAYLFRDVHLINSQQTEPTVETTKLLSSDGAEDDRFGTVAISGRFAIVGAQFNGHGASVRSGRGAAYLFDTFTGQQITKILADDGRDHWKEYIYDNFGENVSIDGSTVIVGAKYDAHDRIANAGAAYLFEISCDPGISVNPTGGLETTEDGGTDTFTVKLNTVPDADVTIDISSPPGSESEGTFYPTSLIFTPENWDTPQEVTVTGVDDDFEDGDVVYEIAVTPSGDLDPVSVEVTNLDNDGQPGGWASWSQIESPPLGIPDNNSGFAISTIDVPAEDDFRIDNMTVNLSISHPRPSDLDVYLILGLPDDGNPEVPLDLIPDAFDGVWTGGKTWTLKVYDTRKKKEGELNGWSITVDY